jgi:hypothetical protein
MSVEAHGFPNFPVLCEVRRATAEPVDGLSIHRLAGARPTAYQHPADLTEITSMPLPWAKQRSWVEDKHLPAKLLLLARSAVTWWDVVRTHTPKVEGALYGTRAPTDRATPLDKQQTNTEPIRFTSCVTRRAIR